MGYHEFQDNLCAANLDLISKKEKKKEEKGKERKGGDERKEKEK